MLCAHVHEHVVRGETLDSAIIGLALCPEPAVTLVEQECPSQPYHFHNEQDDCNNNVMTEK